MDDERKEKVIHTRVSEALDEEIRERAASLGVSVSNLVRNVLQHTFGLVEDVVADAASIARSARGGIREPGPSEESRAPAEERPPSSRVLGWQEAILSLNAVCDACNRILARGTRAGIAVVEGTGARPIRCLDCIEKEVAREPSGS